MWSRGVVLGLCLAGAGPAWGQAADDPGDQPPPARSDVVEADAPTEAELLARQIGLLRTVLHEEAMNPQDRQQAAVQLLQIGTPEAMAVLAEALESAESETVAVAVAEGLIANGPPPEALREPLVRALLRADRSVERLLTRAIVRYPAEDVIPLLRRAAGEASHPANGERRLRAVRALGAFYDDAAIDALINLLGAAEPGPLRREILRALESSTGMHNGVHGIEEWEAWWEAQQQTPREQRLVAIIRTLRSEVEAREERIADLRARFVRMIQLLYTATPPDQRSALLADLLRDEEVSVRRTATELVERAMGDAVALDESVTEALRLLLADDSAGLRARAARLLLNLGDPEVGPAVAEAYLVEQDPATLGEFLVVLARTPQPEVLEMLVAQLEEDVQPGLVGQALLAAADADLLSEQHRRRVRDCLRADNPVELPPSNVRLLARFGSDTDRAELLPLLESAGPEVKRALAGELARMSEFTDLLLERASDPVLYPIALEAVLYTRPTLEGARALLTLTPTNGAAEEPWLETFAALARRLSLSSVRTLDDELQSAEQPLLAERARERVLVAVQEAHPAAPEAERAEWATLLARLAGLRLAQERLAAAASLLDQVRSLQPDSDLYRRTQTEVYLRQGRINDAAQVLLDAALWLDVAEQLHEAQPERFRAICLAVEERFDGQLDSAQQQRLEALLALAPAVEETEAATDAETGEGAPEATPSETPPSEDEEEEDPG